MSELPAASPGGAGPQLVLYRKYRSATFAELVGQRHIAATLANEVASGRLAHAYLFAGIRGTGKTSTARILARAVNCEQVREGEPCNRCGACVQQLSGTSIDVIEIDAASNRGIDEMRDLREKVKYLPAALRRKVYIIDEAHMLTTEAWNAFLKTLEEPPAHVLFMLATTEPHKVPETVRSRVQRFDFRPVQRADVVAHLRGIVDREGVEVEPAALEVLARSARGSIRDALSLLDQALAGAHRPVGVEQVRRALGLADPELLRGLLLALARSEAADALRACAAAFDAGADARQLLREAARLARGAQLMAIGYPQGADLGEHEDELCRELAAIAPSGLWLEALDRFNATETALRQPVDARLQVEHCLLQLTAGRSPTAGLEELRARVAELEAAASAVPQGSLPAPPVPTDTRVPEATPSRPSAPAAAADGPAASPAGSGAAGSSGSPLGSRPDELEWWVSVWDQLVAGVQRRDRMFAAVLRDCRPHSARTGRLVVATDGRFHHEQLGTPRRAELLAEAASELAGSPVVVEAILARPDSHGGKGGASSAVAGRELTEAVLQTFPGSRIVASRLRDEAIDRPQSGPRNHVGPG